MNLYEEAEKVRFLGVEGYRFGFFILIGMAAFAAAAGIFSWAKRCEKGTAPLSVCLSFLLGGIFSRIGFCLMNQELGELMPFSSWFGITGGGWSMTGLIAGVMLAGWLSAKITKQKPGKLLDILTCALPVFMALERFGEHCIPEFDYSRELSTDFLKGTFLAFSDDYGTYLATWKLAGIVMIPLFLVLVWDMIRSAHDGDTCILFLLLYGACSVILESLRYDRFLSISFVGLEQVLGAVMLGIGVTVAAVRASGEPKNLRIAAVAVVLAAAGTGVGLEFALDRTTFSRILIYLAFIIVMAVPVVLGLRLRDGRGKKKI